MSERTDLPDLPPLPKDPRWRVAHLPFLTSASIALLLCAASVGFLVGGVPIALAAAAGVAITTVSYTMSTLVIAWFAWWFFLASFRIDEYSSNAGGLPLWPVKFLLPLGMLLVFLQGVAELIKRVAALTGATGEVAEYERPLQ